MNEDTSLAVACANIAFIKYWGNIDEALRLPANGSISMNLDELVTRTSVRFDPNLAVDELVLNNRLVDGKPLDRVSRFLDVVRKLAGLTTRASVVSMNNFPMGAGIASSASAFAALSLAASHAAGLHLSERDLSRLARLGSGSASRSVPGGFVEWHAGKTDPESYAETIVPGGHFPLVDCIAVTTVEHKTVGSTEGHAAAWSSPLQTARVTDAPRRLDLCRSAIQQRDFDKLAAVMELDSNLMHAVMMTSNPILIYLEPASLLIMKSISEWRKQGLPVCYTLDAGPNVHAICLHEAAQEVETRLRQLPGVMHVLRAHPGGPAHLL